MSLATPLAPLVSKGYHYWPYSSSLGVFLVGVRNRIHHQVTMILRLATADNKLLLESHSLATIPGKPHASSVHSAAWYSVHARCVRSQAPAANGSRSYLHRSGPWPQPNYPGRGFWALPDGRATETDCARRLCQ